MAKPYFQEAIEAPLADIYDLYNNLWTADEILYYGSYKNDLSTDAQKIFCRLLLRRSGPLFYTSKLIAAWFKDMGTWTPDIQWDKLPK